jgi:hypothetical protein
MEVLEQVRQVLELGFPAIVLIMLWLLWSEYRKQVNERINDLREIAGLRASLAKAETSVVGQRAAVPAAPPRDLPLVYPMQEETP